MKKNLSILFFLCCMSSASAQIDLSLYESVSKDSSAHEVSLEHILANTAIDDFLPPLSQLIDTAIVYSPEIRQAEAVIQMAEYRESEVRREYWRMISLGAQAAYGNGLTISSDGLTPGIGTLTAFDQSQLVVGVSIPLELWINRSNRIGQTKAQVEQNKADRDLRLRMLKDQLTNLYFKLIMLKDQLIILGEGAQIGVAIKESMEMNFSKGVLDLEQTSTGMNYWQTSNINYETLKTDFTITYLTLQRMVGIPFSHFDK